MRPAELPRTLVADLDGSTGQRVRLCGWAHSVEPGCVHLRDHTGVVALDGGDVDGLVVESAIEAAGTPVRVDGGELAVEVDALEVVGPAAGTVPVGEGSPLQQRLDWRYLDLRRPRNRLIFEVQTTVERAMRAFWADHGFLELHSPSLRPIGNQSGDELFSVDYFGRRAYLAQSPQFYKQMAMAAGFDRVFEVGPVFRWQPDPTDRHDTEFTSVDVEMSWISSHTDVMALEERLLAQVLDTVRAEHANAIARHFGVDVRVPAVPFPRVTLAEAKKIVEATGWPPGPDDADLDADGERRLGQHIAEQHGHEFVFITDYPELSRPWYHMRGGEGTDATRSFDLLWKGLEITSGAQREHRYEPLCAQAHERGIPSAAITPFLDFFKYGCPPHGGFGLGLTRLLLSLLEGDDVREVTYLFRGPDRITP